MGEFDWKIGFTITVGTYFLFKYFSKKEEVSIRMLYGFLLFSIYVYSGIGIGYNYVSNVYIITYFLFIFFLCGTIRTVLHTRIIMGKPLNDIDSNNQTMFDFDYSNQLVTIFAILFLIANGMHLVVPSFNLLKFFSPGLPTSELIYARRAAASSNIILRICSTINIVCLPFFCLYLKKLVDARRKLFVIFLIFLWGYLSYLQFNYLTRYQITIFLAFAYCIGFFVYPQGIIVKKRYIMMAIVGFIAILPFYNAYVFIRSGLNFHIDSIGESLQMLVNSEITYPELYDVCLKMYGTDSILNFLLWLICLPIPSVLFPGKPVVTITYDFTYAVTGLQYGNQDYYSSLLPSILGEGIILFGPWLTGLYGIIIGFFIGIYFKFIKKFPSLCILHLYMLLMLFTIGRGGASSYMSTLINGTFAMIVWGYGFNKIKRKHRYVYNTKP